MSGQALDALTSRDQASVWHPYAGPRVSPPAWPVASASGVRLTLEDGRCLIDGMSSWWAAIHGYNHPRLNQAVVDQLGRMSHVMFGGLTHRGAVELCERLLQVTSGMDRVFLCDSGSVAVEVAIKMALQFWQAQGEGHRTRLITVRGGYHGDTFGAMSLSDPVNGMHGLFREMLPEHLFAPVPSCAFGETWVPDTLEPLVDMFGEHGEQLAAMVLEPVVQGAGGMRFYHPEYLRGVRALCDRHGVLLVLDEIATGFGRTGMLFGAEHAGVEADIMCLGKALTGGYLSSAATLASARVAEGIAAGGPGVFMHGPTFMGNPLACAVALASLELLDSGPWQERVEGIERQLCMELAGCRSLPQVADVRVLGAIGVIELQQPVDMAVVQPALVERGVWIRPYGRLLYVMPPYVIEAADLSQLTAAMTEVVEQHCAG